jgi:uracil-DNA glycosylase
MFCIFVLMNVRLESSWHNALQKEFEQPYFEKLIQFVQAEYASHTTTVFPTESQVFRALDLCPLNKVKVVILGQDPYPTRGHAHGLCFSVEEHVRPLPKSLNNIFKELETDLGIPFPPNGNLNRWAEQGVLLLNSVLTVREGHADSHAGKGWELFTDAVIRTVSEQRNGVVYLLWGSKAQKKAEFVDSSTNLVLKSVHPSPLSAHRGYFGSKHFSQTNDYLLAHGKQTIVW